MDVRDWFRRVVRAEVSYRPLAPRRDRREAARERQAEGGPGWSDGDRHLNPDGGREVADVAPGTPGHDASRRWIGRR